jgi:NAD(P)-dependent dehydrogenase (short-subunit alcohol dehydrogenase family)
LSEFDDKTVLVTGGTSGIGRAVAEGFAAAGARVTILGRRADGAAAAAKMGARFEYCDVTSEDSVATAFAAVADSVGRIDVLVANAGIAVDEGSLESLAIDDMQRLMDVNVNGVFLALKYGPRHMRDGGSIVATGSVAGSGTANPGAAVYSASKAAVSYLTRTSAIELAPRGIRANTVCPAVIAGTGMMTEDDGSEEARLLASLTALGRMGRLDEVVGAYLFLASDSASFITGQEIRVDGGMTAGFGLPLLDAVGRSIGAPAP